MDARMQKAEIIGGSFLIEQRTPDEVFTPEDLTDEQRMIGETTRQYVDKDVNEALPEIEKGKWDVSRQLLRQAGELGLLGANVPESLGGLELDQVSGVVIAENMGRASGFGVTYGSQTSIGLMPLVYFASEELQQKWIPGIISGEVVTCYCLSEAGSGSDALGAKAHAKLSEDGTHYILNGEKMWISNGGFADIYIVFAKVDGLKEKFSAFLVERDEATARPGAEEHKMGIKASSTTPFIMSDAKVPVGNLIGAVGDGAKIAFNILNVGRFKLGASATGGAKLALHDAVRYANERHQFGRSISSFGAMKHKIGEMATRIFVGESMTYRTVGMIDALIGDGADSEKKLRSIEEYAVESSMNKVFCSEVLDYVVDEMVQIYGGAGYSADYPAEKAYRDARINRIFEGTNEINRMLIPGQLMKRAMKGQLGLLPAAKNLMDEVMNPQPASFDEDGGILSAELKLAQNAKKVALMILGTAGQKYLQKLAEQQEILMGAADLIIEAYAMESAILRAQKLAATGGSNAERYADMAAVYCNDAMQRVEATAKNTLAAMSEGDELRTLLAALRRFTKNNNPINTVAARTRIADVLIGANKYVY